MERETALGAYVPQDRRLALSRGLELADHTTGAALFADISGFTPLTEALVRALGAHRGAEELSCRLNAVYDGLIAEVDGYGGSVMGFAGDAITCWFDGDDGRRAAACGLAMQRAMGAFAAIPMPAGDSVSLAAKVAVASGPARRFLVGDPAIQLIDVLAGATLERMAAGEHHAAKGEVIVDESTAMALGIAATLSLWRADAESGERFAVLRELIGPPPPHVHVDDLAPVPDDELRRWLLPSVCERLLSGGGDFLAELRPVTTLFLGFRGIDYDADPAAGRRLDEYARWVQRTVVQHGGSVLQAIIGDKGSYLYASFGAPIAHGDDAHRAAAAGLALQRPPAALDHIAGTRIGIAQGRVFAGAYGGATRRTYGVLGDPVNLSARLMQNAPAGTVLVDDVVKKAAARAFIWESLPSLAVKGKAEPVAVSRPIVATAGDARRFTGLSNAIPLVGRERELRIINRELDAALAGAGRVLCVSAEAGMGKSRLVAETLDRAGARGIEAHVGECQSYGMNSSYLVWESIWRSFFRLPPGATVEEAVPILERELAAVDPGLLPRLPLLGVLLNLTISDNELTRSLDAKTRKASLEALLVDCVRARARTMPLLLVLEDCHWLDPLSHDLLETVARAITDVPVTLLIAFRPPDVDRLQTPRVTRLPHSALLELQSFTPEEARRLIELKLALLLGDDIAPSAQLVERITERAHGNPFYIEELLNYLHDCGIDPHDARALARLELPTSLHSLILSRIDSLTEREKVTIKVASIVGRQFRMNWLWGVHPHIGASEQVQADLDNLSRLDLAPLDQAEPERIYLFKHSVTREVAYESLPFATRAELHGRLGEFIERSYADTLDGYVDLLAHHFDLSTIEPKRREYLGKAGAAAQAVYANEAALDYYRRLLPLLAGSERIDVLLRLGQVLELVGEWDEADTAYAESLALAVEFGDRRGLASCGQAMGWLLRKRGSYHEAIPHLRAALEGFEELGDRAAMSRAMSDVGELYMRLGEFAEAKNWYTDSLLLTDAVVDREARLHARARALKAAGTLAGKQGDLDVARSLLGESLSILEELGDRSGISHVLINLGNATLHAADGTQARALLERSLRVVREIGDRFAVGVLLNNMGCVASDMGDYADARRLLAESIDVSRQLGDMTGLALALNSLGDVLIDEGDFAGARLVLEESMTISRSLDDRAALTYLLDDFAVLATAEGEAERALCLAGAAEAAREALGARVSPSEQVRFGRLQEPARRALGPDTSAASWNRGRALTLEAAVAYALADSAAYRTVSANLAGATR